MFATKKLIAAFLGAALIVPAAMAQNDEGGFDLSSQRSEKQAVNAVPGKKLDHHGLVINPTPQKLEIDKNGGKYRIPASKTVKDAKKRFAADIERTLPGGVDLTIDFGQKVAKKNGVELRPEAYKLTVGPKGVTIIGYDEAGAFYGLQTLRQILDSELASTGEIPYMTINDWPSLTRRGVIEGFYGEPWSHEVRLSLIDYYGKNKLNSYFYGPKDDPFHSVPNWRQPYPEAEAQKIKELVEASNKNHVDFIWAIHPGADIRWNKEDYDSLVNKLNMMYDLGVRSFAVFFDDIDGEGRNPVKQVELLNNLNREFVKQKGDVSNMVICPTDYSRLWASPDSTGALATYGRSLDKSIEVFYTGDVVCSDLTHDTMNFFNSLIKRPGFYWWNFPVSDYCRNMVLQGPVYGLDPTITADEVVGFASNPMEHGEASKLALYGVADYSWNTPAYNPIDNWERALVDLTPEAAEAYRTFAIHSADTETGYRRDESWETETFPLSAYTPAKAAALKAEFDKIAAVRSTMEANCDNQLLMKELRPWLVEFEKLGQRGSKTVQLMTDYTAGNDSIFWTNYVDAIMTPADRAAYEAHKMGTLKLQPFIDNAQTDMVGGFFERYTGKVPMFYRGIGSFRNASTTVANRMFDNDTTTYYHSGDAQNAKSWLGADLGTIRKVDNIAIRQGRNSKDDVDYFDNVVLQASADGRVWTELTEPMVNTYDIYWSSEQPVDARYIRLKRLDSKRHNWMSVRTFIVNPISMERLGYTIETANPDNALLAFDENPKSSGKLVEGDSWSFPRSKEWNSLTVLSGNGQSIKVAQFDAKGRELATKEFNTPFATVELLPTTSKIVMTSPEAEIFEVIAK